MIITDFRRVEGPKVRVLKRNPFSPFARGLAGWWPMGNRNSWRSNTLYDLSGNNNHGTLTGMDAATDYVLGERAALDCDGVDDYVDAAVVDSSSQGTIAAWIKADSLVNEVIVSSSDEGSSTRYVIVRILSSSINFAQRNNDTEDRIDGSTTLSTGTWYHVAAVSNGTSYTLYINGASESFSVDSGSNSGDWFGDTANRDNTIIGALKRTSVDDNFAGLIDDVRIHNRALSAAEIAQLYRETKSGGLGSLAQEIELLLDPDVLAIVAPLLKRRRIPIYQV